MKTKFSVALLLFNAALLVPAADFTIPWNTIDGGGGTRTSADGRFSVSSTAGQPDVGQSASNDGRFQLNGGFWYGEIIFCGCTLSIICSGGNVTVSWPCDLGGCIVEATDELHPSPPAMVWTPRRSATNWPQLLSRGHGHAALFTPALALRHLRTKFKKPKWI